MLTGDEIARLEEGLPRLSAWGDDLLVPFQARRLAGATVAWLNERWFLERGVDVTSARTRARASAWLVDELGYQVPDPGDPPEAYGDGERTFHADRYGGSGQVPHGGSGRAGLSGCFQGKGIGPTPLVGEVRAWSYSHGRAWLEEGLREAIYGEIAAAEFPHGALPVIAVLDAGLRHRLPSGELGERRAIVVRPAALRLAHFERAPMFSAPTPGRPEREVNDTRDVDRVRDAIRVFVAGLDDGPRTGVGVRGLAEALERVAEQAAFGQVHRLCHGGYLTSNVTLNGELLDYGSFRAVGDWSKVFPLDNMPGFGDELLLLVPAIQSLCFFFRKYGGPAAAPPPETELLARVRRALDARFDRECLRLWDLEDGDGPAAREVIAAMREYVAVQQRRIGSYQLGWVPVQGWLGDGLGGGLGDGAPGPTSGEPSIERRILARIDDALAAHHGSRDAPGFRLARMTAARLLRPRPGLYRERLQGWLWDRIGEQRSPRPPDPDAVAAAVRWTLSSGRRHWPLLGPGLAVRAQVSTGSSSALLCRDVAAGSSCLWVEGTRAADQVHLFDRWLSVDALRAHQAASVGPRWAGRFPVREVAGAADLAASALLFALPRPDDWFWLTEPEACR
ncbi:MAG TPA: hypothetical protein VK698_11750 [Kofleriaceae bacterium]|nr:hypothetical protein [Kofleriaceae bacterium]